MLGLVSHYVEALDLLCKTGFASPSGQGDSLFLKGLTKQECFPRDHSCHYYSFLPFSVPGSLPYLAYHS